MNAAVRATVRVGLYTGAKVYFVHEVKIAFHSVYPFLSDKEKCFLKFVFSQIYSNISHTFSK